MTPPLWTADEAAAAVGGRATRPWTATGVAIDSREVTPGDLFIALAGRAFDGHDFAAQALAGGAAAALVARTPQGLDDAPLLVVEDTQAALEALGRAGRRRSAARVVGVTGSVGKTGTKAMLGHALAALGPTAASVRSFNNHIGVPLSLARLPRDAAYAAFELGMNHAGEIAALTRMVRPDVAIITTVEPAHLEFFPSVAAIADAKAEIFEGMRGGAAVLNRDNPHFAALRAAARARGVERVLSFGTTHGCDVRLAGYTTGPLRNRVSAEIGGTTIHYELGVDGRHWAVNSLAVLAAVRALDGDVAAAAAALKAMDAPAGRGRRESLAWGDGTIELIDDSYNASPASVRAAFAVLAAIHPGAGGRRIAALGDMRELGSDSAALHAGLAGEAVAAGVDLLFTAGDEMRHLHDALPADRRGAHTDDADALAGRVVAALAPGDVVVVKGSLATGMATVVEAIRAAAGSPSKQEKARNAL